MTKFSRAISLVKLLSGEKTNVSKTGFFTAQQFDPADSQRKLQQVR
jgi:hypothetical protein